MDDPPNLPLGSSLLAVDLAATGAPPLPGSAALGHGSSRLFAKLGKGSRTKHWFAFQEPCAMSFTSSVATASAKRRNPFEEFNFSRIPSASNICMLAFPPRVVRNISPGVVHSQMSSSHRTTNFQKNAGDERFLQRHLHL